MIRFISLLLGCTLLLAFTTRADEVAPALAADVQRWTAEHAADAAVAGARVQVEIGQLDPRLQLAPCGRVEPYLPPGSRPWGRTRVGLRCLEGPTHWNVYLPVTVHVMAPALVLVEPLAAGVAVRAEHLAEAEVDWAERRDAPLLDAAAIVGRELARPLAAGEPIRPDDLRARIWFNAGDTVKVIATGPGFSVSATGRALNRGVDGRSVRVRVVGGRIVSGTAVRDNEVELPL